MDSVTARAPGRVNLIGEHTDYNDGFVLPCAIPYGTDVRAVRREGARLTARSASATQAAAFDVAAIPRERRHDWTDYVRGVAAELIDAGVRVPGCDLQVSSTVPMGAGLSSSASLEVALAFALLALSGESFDSTALALLAQRAENDFAGTQCGIMDQFAVINAQPGRALLLDTRSLDFELVELPAGAAIVVCNSMVKHTLSHSAYNTRRSECAQGLRVLQREHPQLRALRDASIEMLEAQQSELQAPLFARCRHVVTENARAREMAAALRAGDLARSGSLMCASHESLRHDYEVSCPELDLLVDLAKGFDGTFGARMTGGGFGGCTVNLVRKERAAAFASFIAQSFADETGVTPEIYDGTPAGGASLLDE